MENNYLKDRIFNSISDPVGYVFLKDNRIFRFIYPLFIKQSLKLLEVGLIDELVKLKLFPKTQIYQFNQEKQVLILEHEFLPVSYPSEWSPSMLKDAALTTLQSNLIAQKYGYYLKDAHPRNILFNGNNPLFIDFGSFSEQTLENSFPITQFIESFLIPVTLFEEGDYYLAHKILLDIYGPNSRILLGKVSNYLSSKIRKYYVLNIKLNRISNIQVDIPVFHEKLLQFALKIKKKKVLNNFDFAYQKTITKITKLKFNQNPKTLWSNYHEQYCLSDDIPSRFDKILNLTNSLKNVESALDIAGNHGFFISLVNDLSKFKRLTLMDYDINSIEFAYTHFKRHNKDINLIASNFIELTYDENIIQRSRSDVVYALALTHHLILTQQIKINVILESLFQIVNQYLFIEFMPLGLWDGKNSPPIPSWYSESWFRENLLYFFDVIQELKLERNRILFLCKKTK